MSVKVEVTPEALTQVRELIQHQAAGTSIRLFVQAGGGGCGDGCGCGASSGPAFGLAFDRARPGDEVIPVDGFSLLVDSTSASSVDGARIDFVRELDRSGFRVIPANAPAETEAPQGSGGCGCGSGGCC
ncbi:MAG TPA: iron-sulfur cluster assembly accessory protein [Thermoplasmata archaeon]|nr:iron-sulfur cluster assembly accessory protein [Thermoplasmata archaeon]